MTPHVGRSLELASVAPQAVEPRSPTREDLIRSLQLAAELEHGVCCAYLYAAFALRRYRDEGLTWKETELTRAWAAVLLRVAREEMGHLGTIVNLLTAIGAAPHFYRPAFPYASLVGFEGELLELRGLSTDAISSFVRLEAGESEDTGGQTIGALYRHVRWLIDELDDGSLFVGSNRTQLRLALPSAVGLVSVSDRASAFAAIDLVVDESDKGPDSHLARFRQIEAALRVNPGFEPSRPVLRNPAIPPDLNLGATPIENSTTAEVARLFDQAYVTMLMLMSRLASPGDESQATLDQLRSIAYVPLMTMVIRPLGELLTTLPADDVGTVTAGPTFRVSAEPALPADSHAAWVRIREGLHELADNGGRLARIEALGNRGEYLHQNLMRIAMNVDQFRLT